MLDFPPELLPERECNVAPPTCRMGEVKLPRFLDNWSQGTSAASVAES